MFGMAFAPVALAFGILHLPHGNAKLLSIVLAAESIPLVIFLLVGGVIADRFPRQKVLLLSQTTAALSYGALALLIGNHVDNTVALCGAAIVSGISGALGWPAASGLIPQVVPEDKLQQGNALLSFGASMARIVGVVAGGAVTAAVGGAWALGVSALCYLACGLCAAAIKPRPLVRTEGEELPKGSMFGDLRDGWGEFTKHEWLWVVVLQWSFLILFFNATHAVIGPVVADEHLGGAKPWSWILTAEAVGDILGVLLAMRWRPRYPILAGVAATAITVWAPFLLLGLGTPVWSVVVAMVPMGMAFSLFNVLWPTTMQREVPAEALSRVSSYDAMGSMMFGPIGLLLAGPAAAIWGSRPAMLICAVGLFIVGVAALASRDVRTLTWREEAVDLHDLPAIPDVAEIEVR